MVLLMKKLYLLRHADSQRIHPMGDLNREISSKGIEELERLALILSRQKFHVGMALCSSATRTRQTWEYISSKLSLNAEVEFLEKLYNSSPEDMLNLIVDIGDQHESAIIISHNPGISEVANKLLQGQADTLSFGTTNIACINFEVARWQEITNNLGKLEWFFRNK